MPPTLRWQTMHGFNSANSNLLIQHNKHYFYPAIPIIWTCKQIQFAPNGPGSIPPLSLSPAMLALLAATTVRPTSRAPQPRPTPKLLSPARGLEPLFCDQYTDRPTTAQVHTRKVTFETDVFTTVLTITASIPFYKYPSWNLGLICQPKCLFRSKPFIIQRMSMCSPVSNVNVSIRILQTIVSRRVFTYFPAGQAVLYWPTLGRVVQKNSMVSHIFWFFTSRGFNSINSPFSLFFFLQCWFFVVFLHFLRLVFNFYSFFDL